MLSIYDMSHRTWNDMQLALDACGLWWVACVTQFMLNIDHGPWANQTWHRMCQQAVDEYLVSGIGGADCPVFESLYDNMVREMSLEGQISDPDLPGKVLSSIPAGVSKKLPNVGLAC